MNRSIVILSVLLLAARLQAAGSPHVFQPLTTSVQQENTGRIEMAYEAFIKVGDTQFAFGLPEGFRLAGDPAHGTLRVENSKAGLAFIFSIAAPGTEIPERAVLLERYHEGRVVAEFHRPVLGRAARVCDVEWKASEYVVAKTRLIFIHTNAGLIEITCTCGLKQFQDGERSLNLVLNSLTDDWKSRQNSVAKGPATS